MFDLPLIPDMVRSHAAGSSSVLRFGRGGTPMTYAQFWTAVEDKLRVLAACGFEPRQRVALTVSSTLDSAAMIIALLHAGGTVVPLYYRKGMAKSAKHISRIVSVLRVTRAQLAFTHADELAMLAAAASQADVETRTHAYERVIAHPSAPVMPAISERDQTWPALIQFSAGSTAEPKGICIQQRQFVINLRGGIDRFDGHSGDRMVSWLPLYHDLGLGGLLLALYSGAGLTLFSPDDFIRDPMSWLAQISEDRATCTAAPQFAFNLCLLKHTFAPGTATYDLSSLRVALNGAEVVDPERCEAFETHFARFGLRRHVIVPCYGLAENCVGVCVRPAGVSWLVRGFERSSLVPGARVVLAGAQERPIVRAGNGQPVPGTEVSVLDDVGCALPDGTVGEIAVSGASVATAILNADGTLQRQTMPLRTGDLGMVYDGELFVVGRIKEMVKRGGESLSPTDIEQCVSTHVPGYPVAAFGFLDEHNRTEELVVLIETFRWRDAAHCAELAARVRAVVLREFHLPLADVLVTNYGTIPRTTSGKVRRVALRDQYVANRVGGEPAVDSRA